ncbi:MAG: hypothetical protein LAT76_08125 [Schleiferiaceae bacterium]|nr:hypothetical protein [Schleiferiaceae bacterium]
MTNSVVLKYAALGIIGAVVGYSYYHFFGCTSGCSIKSNPYQTTLLGAALFMFAYTPPKKEEKSVLHSSDEK